MTKLPKGTEVFYSKDSKITYLVLPRGVVKFVTKDGHVGDTYMIGRNTRVAGQGYDNAKLTTVRGNARRKLANLING